MASKAKPALKNEDRFFNVRVPNWPYEKWELPESTKRQVDFEKTSSPVHNIPVSVGPVFHSFLDSFGHQLDIYNNCTSTELLTQVTTMLNDSLCELGKSYKCFEKCQLIQAGSVAEKTKVEALDEFDFLVVMEYFADKEYFEIVLRQGLIRIYVKDTSVIEFLPIECQNHSGSIEFLDVTLRSKFMELFIEIFDESLPSGWRRVTTEGTTLCGSGIASTLHLVCEKLNLNIDIDLCLCLPVSADDFEGALSIPEQVNPQFTEHVNAQLLLFGYINNIMRQSPLKVFVILGKADFSFEAISTRITAPFLELSHFQSLPPEDGRIRAYCTAKCILSALLPELSDIFGCKRCSHKLVRSYHIKNILFFMLKNYKADIHWEEDKVPLRVLEIFSVLEQCTIDDDESSYDAAVSKFCFPGTLYVQNVSNLSQYCNREGEHRYFFTPDSHKPMYELSSSPVYEQYLSTGNDTGDTLLNEWFEKLNNKPWNSKQLLQDLFNLLKKLNEIIH